MLLWEDAVWLHVRDYICALWILYCDIYIKLPVLLFIGNHEGEGEPGITKVTNQLQQQTLEDQDKEDEPEEGLSEVNS